MNIVEKNEKKKKKKKGLNSPACCILFLVFCFVRALATWSQTQEFPVQEVREQQNSLRGNIKNIQTGTNFEKFVLENIFTGTS